MLYFDSSPIIYEICFTIVNRFLIKAILLLFIRFHGYFVYLYTFVSIFLYFVITNTLFYMHT